MDIIRLLQWFILITTCITTITTTACCLPILDKMERHLVTPTMKQSGKTLTFARDISQSVVIAHSMIMLKLKKFNIFRKQHTKRNLMAMIRPQKL